MAQCNHEHVISGEVWYCVRERGHVPPHRDDKGRTEVKWSEPVRAGRWRKP
jgi:hypothetical protein